MTPPTEDAKALFERFDWMRDSGICSPTTRSLLDDAEALIRRQVSHPEPEEWEYGVTTKWGPRVRASLGDAETYAEAVRTEIERRRSSGDLRFHGLIMRRRPAVDAGPWLPVPEEGS